MRKAVVFMKKAQVVERKINAALVKVELYQSMTQRITASLGGERVSHTRNVGANEDAMIRLADAHDKLDKLKAEYDAAVDEITDVVGNMEDQTQQTILLDHYLGHLEFEEIAAKLNLSRSNIYDQHKAGLDDLETLLSA